jgi:hypothetical protein
MQDVLLQKESDRRNESGKGVVDLIEDDLFGGRSVRDVLVEGTVRTVLCKHEERLGSVSFTETQNTVPELTLLLDSRGESAHAIWYLGTGIPQHPHELSSKRSLVSFTGEESNGLSILSCSSSSSASVHKVL